MSNKKDLEFFGNVKTKTCTEGLGYYIMEYESPETFNNYPEAKEKFIKANEALQEFRDYIEGKIIENGGEIEDYEA